MSTIPYSPTEVAALRSQMAQLNQKLSPTVAWEILRKVGDRDLAVTALLMKPRPGWLTSMLDPSGRDAN